MFLGCFKLCIQDEFVTCNGIKTNEIIVDVD